MKKTKKFLSLILSAVMLTIALPAKAYSTDTVWDGSVAESFATGTGSAEDPYIIRTAEQFVYFARSVYHNNYKNAFIVLENNIKLNDTTNWKKWGESDKNNNIISPQKEWNPINYFRGTFDGGNHTVSGIYINSGYDNQGLFGNCSGTIKNLGVIDSYIGGNNIVGGVVGYSEGIVENCYNAGNISGKDDIGGVVGRSEETVESCRNTGNINGKYNVGGVVGYSRNFSHLVCVKSCYNTGKVSGEYDVGGVVGNSEGTVEFCHNTGTISGKKVVGGVIGIRSATLSDTARYCYNTGFISGENDVGGVIGVAINTTAKNCYNTGTVTGKSGVGGIIGNFGVLDEKITAVAKDCYNIGKINGGDDVGGVIGINFCTATNACYNTGEINGNERVGGVVGNNSGWIAVCYNTGSVSGNSQIGGMVGNSVSPVSRCYNTGVVSGKDQIGGIVGKNEYNHLFHGDIDYCYNIGKIRGDNNIGGIVGTLDTYCHEENCYYLENCGTNLNNNGTPLSSTQLANKKSFKEWDFDYTWEIGYKSDYNYPVLQRFRIYGDVNGDDNVNSADALMILQNCVEIIRLDKRQLKVADVDSDTQITTNDALMILQFAVGILYEFPAQQ